MEHVEPHVSCHGGCVMVHVGGRLVFFMWEELSVYSNAHMGGVGLAVRSALFTISKAAPASLSVRRVGGMVAFCTVIH